MTPEPPALSLPSADWEGWLASRCDGQLAAARRLTAVLKDRPEGRNGRRAMALWNDLNLALRNAFAVASLLSNVHPDEPVRTRAEQAEQDASRVQTETELDRDLYDVLAGVDPGELDEDARRVHTLAVRDFHRAGVDQDEAVRARLRRLAERKTEVEQEFAKNIRDDVRSVRVAPAALDGLPRDFVEAHPPGEDGLVEIAGGVSRLRAGHDVLPGSRRTGRSGHGVPEPRLPGQRARAARAARRFAASTRGSWATTAGRRTTRRSR